MHLFLKPRHILLAWEYGRNLGHLVRLIQVQRLMQKRGGTCTLVVPDAYVAHPWLLRSQVPVRVAPPLRPLRASQEEGRRRVGRLYSFADVLFDLGFAEVAALEVAVAGWLELFSAEKPQGVLCDYAPVAQLAARLAGLPTTQLTNGFDAPPPEFPLFDRALRGPHLERLNAERVDKVAASVERVGRSHGVTDLRLHDLMRWARKMLDGIPETDPYGPRVDAAYVGPFIAEIQDVYVPQWRADIKRKRIFGYLRGSMAPHVLGAISSVGASAICVWPDATEDVLCHYKESTVQLTKRPVDLGIALAGADAVINYGSSSVVSCALLAGKPQMMVPTDVEKLILSRRIEQQGAGIIWRPGMASLPMSIDRLLSDSTLDAAAATIARRHSPRDLRRQRDSAIDITVFGEHVYTRKDMPHET